MFQRSDEQLMQDVAGRDMAAFGELIHRHQRFVWAVAYRFLGDPSEAEDVVQETFLRLLKAAPRYRPVASLRSYLFRIASRLSVDIGRRRGRLRLGAPSPETPDLGPDPADVLSAKGVAARVRQALSRLPSRQRMAVVGRYYAEMSYAEIAASMGVSDKAVERLLGRARKTLAAELRLDLDDKR